MSAWKPFHFGWEQSTAQLGLAGDSGELCLPCPRSCRWITGTSLQPWPLLSLSAPGAGESRQDSGE